MNKIYFTDGILTAESKWDSFILKRPSYVDQIPFPICPMFIKVPYELTKLIITFIHHYFVTNFSVP